MRNFLLSLPVIVLTNFIISCENSNEIRDVDPYRLPNKEIRSIWIYADGSVTSIKDDNVGNIWVSFDGGGLVCYNNTSVNYYNSSNVSVMDNRVVDFEIDKTSNTIYVATQSSGLLVFKDGVWECYNKYNSGLPSDYIAALTLDSNGNVWLASSSYLAKFDGSKVDVLDASSIKYPDSNKYAMRFVNDILLIGAFNGLVVFDGVECKIINKTSDGNDFRSIFEIAVDSKENIWLGGNYGLGILKGSEIIKQDIPDEVLVCKNIYSMSIDSNDNIWCATNSPYYDGGLIKYDHDSNKWMYLKSLSNISYEYYYITEIFIDKYDNKWINLNGVSIYNEGGVKYYH